MSKSITPIALTLALAFAAGAHADTATSTGDVYRESIWDVQATADAGPADTGKSAAADVYPEAIWEVQAAFDHTQMSDRLAAAQKAERAARPADLDTLRFNIAE